MNRISLLLLVSVLASGCPKIPRYKAPGTLGAALEDEFERNAELCSIPKDSDTTFIPSLVRAEYDNQLATQFVKKAESTRLQTLFSYAFFKGQSVSDAENAGISPERMIQYNVDPTLVLQDDSDFDSVLYRFSCAHAAQARLDAKASLGAGTISKAISADQTTSSRFALFGGTYTSPLYLALKGTNVAAKRQAQLFLWAKYAAHPEVYDPADGSARPEYVTSVIGWTTAKLSEGTRTIKADARGAFSAGVALAVTGEARAEASLDSYFRLSKATIFVNVDDNGKERLKRETLPPAADIANEFKRVKFYGSPVGDRAFASTVTASSYRYPTAAVPEPFCKRDSWSPSLIENNNLLANVDLVNVQYEKTECAFYLDYTVSSQGLRESSIPVKIALTFASPVKAAPLQMIIEANVLTTKEPELSGPSNSIPSYRLETLGPVQFVHYSIDLIVRDANAHIDRTEMAQHSISDLVVTCGEVNYSFESPQLQRPPSSNGGLLRVSASLRVPLGKTAQQNKDSICSLQGKVSMQMERIPNRPPRVEKRDLLVSVLFPSIQ